MERNATLEREIKLRAPEGLALPDLRALVGGTVRLPEEHSVTRYFDTSDRRLWRQGMTFRHRVLVGSGADGEGDWTLKLPGPGSGSALERTEVTWPGPSHELPGEAQELLRGLVRRAPLEQLTLLETTRRRLVLRHEEGHDLAELDDDLVAVVSGPRAGLRFRQVELEFRDEKWKGRRVVRRLEEAGARVEDTTKLAKAVALPPRADGPTLDEKATMADVVLGSLRAGLLRLLDHDWQLRLAQPEPTEHDVHQARVATRRLRSDLKTFGDILDPLWRDHMRSELKWLGSILGELRDKDVLSEGLPDAPAPVLQRLAVQRVEAGRRLAEAMASDRYVNLLDRLHAASTRLPLAAGCTDQAQRSAADSVPGLVAARWHAVRRQVRRAGPHPSPSQLHRIRIKAKQLRYAAEAVRPVIGPPAHRTAAAAEEVQTILGDHHDAVAAETWLRNEFVDDLAERTSTVSPSVAFEVGRMVAAEQCHAAASAEQWVDAWPSLRKPTRHRWLSRN